MATTLSLVARVGCIVALAVAASAHPSDFFSRTRAAVRSDNCEIASCVDLGELCGFVTIGKVDYYYSCDPLSAYCNMADESDNGTCVAQLAPGATCEDNQQCKNWWKTSDFNIKKRSVADRKIADGACLDSKCIAFGLKVGEKCTHNESCMLTGVCTNGKCADYTYVGLGQNCSHKEGTWCDSDMICYDGKCVAMVTDGESCTNSVCAGYCDATEICRWRSLGRGKNCTDSEQCKEGLFCGHGLCIDNVPEVKQNCTYDSNCSDYYECGCSAEGVNGVCVPSESVSPLKVALEQLSFVQSIGHVSDYENDMIDQTENLLTLTACGESKAASLGMLSALALLVSSVLSLIVF